MPVFSYLAFPRPGSRERLCAALALLPHCAILPATDHDLLVVVTDTPDDNAEAALQRGLKALPGLQSLSLVFGSDEPQERT